MLTLIIPFYNEERFLADTIERATGCLSSEFTDYELILVDDGSTDSSCSIAKTFQSNSTRVLTYKPNLGKGYAVKTGMLAASGAVVFFTDADLPYGLDALKTGYASLKSGQADVVVGSRNMAGKGFGSYPPLRKAASHAFLFAVNALLGLGLSDCQCGFKGFTREAARRVFNRVKTKGFAFDMEALYLARCAHLKILEIPVELKSHSDSKVRLGRDSLLMLRDLIRIRITGVGRKQDME